MSKSLLIVESPTKAKTLERYLGKDFIVKASVGHIKDLPQNKLGIDLEKQFLPEYRVIRGKKKIVNELNQAAAKADAIYLGPDPDREGEAIAWHIAEELETNGKPLYRVLFYELTQKAIQHSLNHPDSLNKGLYDAQQARRILDRLVGYLISPLLWSKVKRGLSAGRVQSVAMRLICEREREVQAFAPEEYWTIDAELQPAEKKSVKKTAIIFRAALNKCGKKKCTISSGDEAHRLVDLIKPKQFEVVKVEQKQRRRTPAPPFITSTLQQEAARKLRFSAKRTMGVAQRLYEGLELG
ncbi:MAG: DNA topoisomerase, partial [Desulforhabdus sp.]|nr:DNA topoisomerase [Desulforhabdus sp.]